MTKGKTYYKISYNNRHEVFIYVINKPMGSAEIIEEGEVEDTATKDVNEYKCI